MVTLPARLDFEPSIWVREIQTADGAALLDIRHGLCLSLNAVGTEIWRLLRIAASTSQIADELANQFDTPRDRILNDIRHFIADLSQKGLLTPSQERRPRSRRAHDALLRYVRTCLLGHCATKCTGARFLLVKALIALFVFDVLGFSNDFAAMHEIVRKWPITNRANSVDHLLNRVCNAVNFACVWYPKRVLCLQRSAITTCLLRNCGVQAWMVIGAQKCPFKAHAWTEIESRAVNERVDVRRSFLVWERC
jgi:hypothetical protein